MTKKNREDILKIKPLEVPKLSQKKLEEIREKTNRMIYGSPGKIKDLISIVKGRVTNVHGQTNINSRNIGPLNIGGYNESISYETYHTELEIDQGDSRIKIVTPGWPPVRAGESVRAYLFLGHERRAAYCSDELDRSPVYEKQDLKDIEKARALMIEIIEGNNVVAAYGNVPDKNIRIA